MARPLVMPQLSKTSTPPFDCIIHACTTAYPDGVCLSSPPLAPVNFYLNLSIAFPHRFRLDRRHVPFFNFPWFPAPSRACRGRTAPRPRFRPGPARMSVDVLLCHTLIDNRLLSSTAIFFCSTVHLSSSVLHPPKVLAARTHKIHLCLPTWVQRTTALALDMINRDCGVCERCSLTTEFLTARSPNAAAVFEGIPLGASMLRLHWRVCWRNARRGVIS